MDVEDALVDGIRISFYDSPTISRHPSIIVFNVVWTLLKPYHRSTAELSKLLTVHCWLHPLPATSLKNNWILPYLFAMLLHHNNEVLFPRLEVGPYGQQQYPSFEDMKPREIVNIFFLTMLFLFLNSLARLRKNLWSSVIRLGPTLQRMHTASIQRIVCCTDSSSVNTLSLKNS